MPALEFPRSGLDLKSIENGSIIKLRTDSKAQPTIGTEDIHGGSLIASDFSKSLPTSSANGDSISASVFIFSSMTTLILSDNLFAYLPVPSYTIIVLVSEGRPVPPGVSFLVK